MIVDDEIDFLTLLKLGLEMSGDFEVREVYAASRVLEVAKDFRPHLVILDCMMPELSGDEVLAQLRADPVVHDVPVIFVTATVAHKQLRPGQDGRPYYYLPKPLRLSDLLGCISELVPDNMVD